MDGAYNMLKEVDSEMQMMNAMQMVFALRPVET